MAATPAPAQETRLLPAYLERRRRQGEHDAAQRHLRAVRKATPQPLDWMDDANQQKRWDHAMMVATQDIDDMGTPKLRERFALHLDDARLGRYQDAWRELCQDRPAQAAAYHALFLHERVPDVTPEVEEAAAHRLGIDVSLLRRRAWKAVRQIQDACAGDIPVRVSAWADARMDTIRRTRRDERAAHWKALRHHP